MSLLQLHDAPCPRCGPYDVHTNLLPRARYYYNTFILLFFLGGYIAVVDLEKSDISPLFHALSKHADGLAAQQAAEMWPILNSECGTCIYTFKKLGRQAKGDIGIWWAVTYG